MIPRSGGGGGDSGSCGGVLVNSSYYGQCFCECEHHLHVDVGVKTVVGTIIGIHMTTTAIYCYTLMALITMLLIFTFLYPLWERFEKLLKRLLEVFKRIPKLGEFTYQFLSFVQVPFSGWLIILGLFFGGLFKITGFSEVMKSDDLLFFDHEILFLFLIPPLILATGFFFEKVIFLKNFPIITAHAVFGTLCNMVLIGFSLYLLFHQRYSILDCFVYSSLISAIDPVAVITIFHQKKVNDRIDVLLESESILNDAVAIVMFTVFKSLRENFKEYSHLTVPLAFGKFFWVVLVALVVGVSCGLIASFLLKFTFHNHELENFQVIMVFLFAMLSYFLSESLHSSGIFGIMVCSIVMSQYLKYRLSKKNRKANELIMHMVGSICEGLIFFYLGMAVIVFDHEWDWALIVSSNVMIFCYRFMVVFSISLVFNLARACSKREIIPWSEVFIQAFAGIRGAVSYALVYMLPETIKTRSVFVTSTTTVIFLTIFLQSSFISSLVYALKIEKKKLPVEKKVQQFTEIRNLLSKIIVYIPVEHSSEDAKQFDKEFKSSDKKKLLAKETMKCFHNLTHHVNDALEIRIGEHAYIQLQKTNEIEMKSVDKIYTKQKDEMELVKDLYRFCKDHHHTFELLEGTIVSDKRIREAGKKIHDLVEFRDRISFLVAKLLQSKYDEKNKSGIKEDYSAFVVKVLTFLDRSVQWVVNRKGIVKQERKFIRSYFKYKNFCDLHMYEHIATKEGKGGEILTLDKSYRAEDVEIDSPSSLSSYDGKSTLERSATFRDRAEIQERKFEKKMKQKRLKEIQSEIKVLQSELKGIYGFMGGQVADIHEITGVSPPESLKTKVVKKEEVIEIKEDVDRPSLKESKSDDFLVNTTTFELKPSVE